MRTRKHSFPAGRGALFAAASLLAMFTGCVAAGGGGYAEPPPTATIVYDDDDYDYYPGYELYYSRKHRDYVYRQGNAWVRRPAPYGVRPDGLRTAPSVHMDFHDAPEHHHRDVAQRYPKTWTRPVGEPAGGDTSHRGEHGGGEHPRH